MIALDYTQRIAPAALKAADVTQVFRYLSNPSASWKVIGKTEYTELIQAGIKVNLNWEFDAEDWNTTNGSAHGNLAAAQAHLLGYPAGYVIYGSADFNMTRAQWDARGKMYGRAFKAAVEAAGFNAGVYGPWDVLTWCHDELGYQYFWQAGMSTSWSGGRNANKHPLAQYRQRGHKTVGGIDTDWNDILAVGVATVTTAEWNVDDINNLCFTVFKSGQGPLHTSIAQIKSNLATIMTAVGQPFPVDQVAPAIGAAVAEILVNDQNLPHITDADADKIATHTASVIAQHLSAPVNASG